MLTIEKFKDNLKNLDEKVFTSFNHTPTEEEIKEEIKNYGHGLYLISKWKEKEYWLWFGDDFLIFDRKLSIKQYNNWKKFLEL